MHNYYWNRVQEMASALGLSREELGSYSLAYQTMIYTTVFRDELDLAITSISMTDSYTLESDFEDDCRKCIRALRDYASWKKYDSL